MGRLLGGDGDFAGGMNDQECGTKRVDMDGELFDDQLLGWDGRR